MYHNNMYNNDWLSEEEIIELVNNNPDKEYDSGGNEIIQLENKTITSFKTLREYENYIKECANFVINNTDKTIECPNPDVARYLGMELGEE